VHLEQTSWTSIDKVGVIETIICFYYQVSSSEQRERLKIFCRYYFIGPLHRLGWFVAASLNRKFYTRSHFILCAMCSSTKSIPKEVKNEFQIKKYSYFLSDRLLVNKYNRITKGDSLKQTFAATLFNINSDLLFKAAVLRSARRIMKRGFIHAETIWFSHMQNNMKNTICKQKWANFGRSIFGSYLSRITKRMT